jgi:hypothetical protein
MTMLKTTALACLLLLVTSHAFAQQVERPLSLDPAHVDDPDARTSSTRPLPLIPLYLSFATLQMFDVHSTMLAVHRGAHELNPLVRSIDAEPVAMTAFKLGTTAATVLFAEKLWRDHRRTAAVISMVALNGTYAWIVASNYRTASRLPDR